MISYGHLITIYATKWYYVLRNDKKEAICFFPAEEKDQHKALMSKFNFELTQGKDF